MSKDLLLTVCSNYWNTTYNTSKGFQQRKTKCGGNIQNKKPQPLIFNQTVIFVDWDDFPTAEAS